MRRDKYTLFYCPCTITGPVMPAGESLTCKSCGNALTETWLEYEHRREQEYFEKRVRAVVEKVLAERDGKR